MNGFIKRDCRNLSFWSWNGKMENDEINIQIESLANSGYGGFFMHARAGLEIPYLGEHWFEIVNLAIEQAQKFDMDVWIYDEYGWPSGFAGGIVPSNGIEYWFKRMFYTFNIEDCNNGTFICSYKKDNGKYYVAKKDESELFFYYTVDSHYVDLLNPNVTQKFIESTHEVYKKNIGGHFGKTVKGIFTDEPQLSNGTYTWSFELCSYYTEQTGQNLLDNLWMLAIECEQTSKFKHDYYKCINSLMTKSFTKPIFDWCEENGLIFTGHFAAEDSLLDQVYSSGGVMPNYQYMKMPGIDHLGRRIASPIVMKQVTSVAKQMGYPYVISETFGCCGWNTPFSELSWIWGYQASLGINVACLHLSAYTINGVRKRDYPAFFSYQEPWWDKFNYLSKWMNNINSILTMGETKTDILLITPLTGIWSEISVNYSDKVKYYASQFRIAVENLLDVQVDFDIGDETIIRNHASVNGKVFKVGRCTYNKIIISATSNLEDYTIALLKELINNGGEVIFVNSIPGDIFNNGSHLVIQNRREFWRKYFDKIQYSRDIFILEQGGFCLATNIVIKTKKYDGKMVAFIVNKVKDATRNIIIATKGIKTIYEINPVTMIRNPIEVFYDCENTYSELVIDRFQTVLLEIVDKVDEYKKLILKSIEYPDFSVRLCDENSMNLDFASYSFDGINFSDYMPAIYINDKMYDYISKQNEDVSVTLRYNFNCIISNSTIKIAIEDKNVSEIRVNNNVILKERIGWYIDKSIGVYDISPYVICDLNIVDIICKVTPYKLTFNVDEVFETERNRFSYPIETESIYILGDFDVEAKGIVNIKATCKSITNADFTLIPKTEKDNNRDLTEQGLWFYRGSVIYSSIIEDIPKYNKVIIHIPKLDAVLAEIFVDGCLAGCVFNYPFELDITKYFIGNTHKIDVKIYGSNRNILGPHHHINGENTFVGNNTFKGTWGFEDFVVNQNINASNTWTDDYSFVKFGCYDICIKYYY